MNLPYRLGTPTADGGLLLNEAEKVWLGEVIKRTETAFAEIAISLHVPPPPDYIEGYTARALAEVVSAFAVRAVMAQTEEDEHRDVQKHRAEITIIKGGLPPRPAF